MASIEKRASKAGGVRYVARFRVNGRTDERWFSTLAAARSYETRIEAEAQDEVLIDPRAGAQSLDHYFNGWVADRLV